MSNTSPLWRKSRYSESNTCNCVEVASIDGRIALRDSTDPDGPVLYISHVEWATLVGFWADRRLESALRGKDR